LNDQKINEHDYKKRRKNQQQSFKEITRHQNLL